MCADSAWLQQSAQNLKLIAHFIHELWPLQIFEFSVEFKSKVTFSIFPCKFNGESNLCELYRAITPQWSNTLQNLCAYCYN